MTWMCFAVDWVSVLPVEIVCFLCVGRGWFVIEIYGSILFCLCIVLVL